MREKTGLFGGSPAEMRNQYRTGIQRIPLALYELEAPTIAAVNGPAMGAGCDLALMCDIRIASDTAIFAESFVKLGIVPGDGGAWLLPRVEAFQRHARWHLQEAASMRLARSTASSRRELSRWGSCLMRRALSLPPLHPILRKFFA